MEIDVDNIVNVLIDLGYYESYMGEYMQLTISDSCHYYGTVSIWNCPNWIDVVKVIIGKKLASGIGNYNGSSNCIARNC